MPIFSLISFFMFRDEEDHTDAEVEIPDNLSVASASGSQATITPETVSSSSAPAATGSEAMTYSTLRRSHTVSNTHVPQVNMFTGFL